MQKTSATYREMMGAYQSGDHHIKFDTRLAIGESGVLIDKSGDAITFGGVSVLLSSSSADSGYDESMLISMTTESRVFGEETLSVGSCVASQIDIEMVKPDAAIPKAARIVPYVRLTDGNRKSEWLQKGVYYIDTRESKNDGSGIAKLVIRGYDDMLRTEQDYPNSKLVWPAKDIDVVKEIANYIKVDIDPRTFEIMTNRYEVPIAEAAIATEYSCREILGYIAAMYAGSFVMTESGELRLVTFWGIPPETRYLVTGNSEAIVIGGVRILV